MATSDKGFLIAIILLIVFITTFFHMTLGGKALMAGGIVLQIIGFFYIAYAQRRIRVIDYDTKKPTGAQGSPVEVHWVMGAWTIIIGLSLQFSGLLIPELGPFFTQ